MLGIVGIEDILRPHVPQTLKMMRDGGIRVWICSGDKYETTLSIARYCKLFDDNSKKLYLLQDDKDLLASKL